MLLVPAFEGDLQTLLPQTYDLLKAANFVIHDKVAQVTLHGSRGLAGRYHHDSDIDLSLIVDTQSCTTHRELESLLRDVLYVTLDHWRSTVKADVAVIFDIRRCTLFCFAQRSWADVSCVQGGVDCFGLYKLWNGSAQILTNAGVRTERMYPCLVIYRNRANQ